MTGPNLIAAELAPMWQAALIDCCKRGITRTNDGGLVDTFLSTMCSNTDKGIYNGWLVKWEFNPTSREDGYINRYVPTPLGQEVATILKDQTNE